MAASRRNVDRFEVDIAVDQPEVHLRASQSASATTTEGAQSGAPTLGSPPEEESQELSQSILDDRPPLLPIFVPEGATVRESASQSGPSDPSVRQSRAGPSNPGARTDQSAPPYGEEASERIHPPLYRRRIVLDSHPDDDEAPSIDLARLLAEETEEIVVVTTGPSISSRGALFPAVDSESDDDTDLDSDHETVVIEDSDTDDEPMEVAVSPLRTAASERASAGPLQVTSSAAHSRETAPEAPSGDVAPVQVPPAAGATAAPAGGTAEAAGGPVLPAPDSTSAPAPAPAPSGTAVAPSSGGAPAGQSGRDPVSSAVAAKDLNDSEDESQSCIICYEPWTNSGEHRLASLKCGHLFGHSCILKWLRGAANLKCPQCNAKAKKADIRIIYAKALRTIDTSERDRALDNLRKEKEVRRKAEIDMAQTNLRYRMAIEEVNRLKAQISAQQAMIRSSSSLQMQPGGSSKDQKADGSSLSRGQYNLDKSIQISQTGNCRVMGFDQFHSALVVSMPSQNHLFPGFGVKKVSALDLRCTQYVPIHSAMIRGLAFNGRGDGLMLTASADKSVKMTSLVSNTVVQTYKTTAPVWSCAWNSSDVNYVYAGLQNGSIMVYDTRRVDQAVHSLTLDNSRCPIVSLSYVSKAADRVLGCSGLLTASLGGMAFWEQSTETEFKPHLLQMDGVCTSLCFNDATRHCLASFRPNKNHNRTRHLMCEMRNERKEAEGLNEVACYPVQTFYGGATMKVLSRSVLYQNPDRPDHLLACTGDEATSSALVWDTATGNQIQKLQVNATVLDVCPFQFNRQSFLAALTDKQVKLFKWQQAR